MFILTIFQNYCRGADVIKLQKIKSWALLCYIVEGRKKSELWQ